MKNSNVYLECQALCKTYEDHGQKTKAINNGCLQIRKGEILGLIGESGSGKSTIGRLILGLLPNDEGKILFEDQEISGMSFKEMKTVRRKMQMIFQDPMDSLNPRFTVGQLISDPLEIHKIGNRKERDQA